MDLPLARAVFFDLGDTLVLPTDRSWVPGAQAALSGLRERGLRLGVISNTADLSRAELTPLLPVDFDWAAFDDRLVILSAEVGVEKPAPGIFRLAVTAAAIPASGCLFCTENLPHAIAAQRVGMLSARVRPPPNSDVGGLVAALVAAGVLG